MHTKALSRQALIAALTFGGFFLLGYGGIFVWGGNSHSSSPIWPATAFGFVMLIRLSRSRGDDAVMLAAMLAAGFAANRLGGASPLLALGFSLINVLDVLAGLVAFRRLCPSRVTSNRAMAKFVFVAAHQPVAVRRLPGGWPGRAPGRRCRVHRHPVVPGQPSGRLHPLSVRPDSLAASVRQAEAEAPLAGSLWPFRRVGAHICAGVPLRLSRQFLVLVLCIATAARFRLLGAGAALLVVSTLAFATVRTMPQAQYRGLGRDPAILSRHHQRGQRAHRHAAERARRAYRHHRAAASARCARLPLQEPASRPCQPRSAHVRCRPSSAFPACWNPVRSRPPSGPRNSPAIIAHNGELLQRLHDDLLDLIARRGRRAVHPARARDGCPTLCSTCVRRHPPGHRPGRQECAGRTNRGRAGGHGRSGAAGPDHQQSDRQRLQVWRQFLAHPGAR